MYTEDDFNKLNKLVKDLKEFDFLTTQGIDPWRMLDEDQIANVEMDRLDDEWATLDDPE